MARFVLLVAAVAAAVAVALGSSAASPERHGRQTHPLTRYSLVHGCYQLRARPGGKPIAAARGPFRMQATALGVYLLYRRHRDYLVGTGKGAFASSGTPSTAAEWRVTGRARKGFKIANLATRKGRGVRFVPARRCAVYPEAQVNAKGTPFKGASPEAAVKGTAEGHAHVTAFEFLGGDFHCGQPWSRYGAPYALPASCAHYEQGANGGFESFLDFGGPTRPSDMHGWPTFKVWPSPTTLVEEGDYWTGIERAWKAGLRLMETNLVDNEALCSVMTVKHNPCNDMAAVRIQHRDLYALQGYIDAQSGGPGKGWFRIVTNPFQARRVINQGKLAVIEGIEVSRLFGCGEMSDVPQCGRPQIDAGLREVRRMGVRTFFPVHEFDNAFGGTKMIAGDTGMIVNAGNRDETGSFWTLHSCPASQQDAEQLSAPNSGPAAQLLNGPMASLLHGNPLPVYGPPPQCNVRGLTGLGAYLIGRMIKQHLMIQLDHMSSKTATAALSIAEKHHYAGVISAHCCSSPQLFRRIYSVGGFITPPVMPTEGFTGRWKLNRNERSRYRFGFGWGSDLNGLGAQPGPTVSGPIKYPFKSYDGGVTFNRERWGQRVFDFNKDGLANYGMYADWLRQLQSVGGRPEMNDMFQGAEAYLDTWERAYGIRATSCRPGRERFDSGGLGKALRLGDSARTALYRAGQPLSRIGRSYGYCVAGDSGRVAAVLSARGRVAMITSTAAGDSAGGIGPGDSAGRLGSHARQLMPGVWLGPNGRVYGARGGRVSFVAVATASELRSAAQLRSDLRAASL
jgi:hypothetical protein